MTVPGSPKPLSISVWSQPQATIGRRFVAPLTCATASLILHAILFAPLILAGSTSHPQPPQRDGSEASAEAFAESNSMTLISIPDPNDSAGADTSTPFPPMSQMPAGLVPISARLNPKVLDVSLVIPDDEDSGKQVTEAQGDSSAHALMYGRYLGQITARISRAWIRPRTPVPKADTFVCLVQIDPERDGTVKEVTLKRCNGDARWELSLVRAVQSASPLPAPPDPTVFKRSVTLEMETEPYGSGKGSDGFEPAAADEATAIA